MKSQRMLLAALPLALFTASACYDHAEKLASPPVATELDRSWSSTDAIDADRIAVLVDPIDYQFAFAAQSHSRHSRYTAYVSHFADTNRYVRDAGWCIWNGTSCSGDARTPSGWFYYDVAQYRAHGHKLVIVFHAMPASDRYGATLPQFIANTLRPAPNSNDPNVQWIDDVVIAVQPGNENNTFENTNVTHPDSAWTPILHGWTAWERGASLATLMKNTRAALNGAGMRHVKVWTPGLVLDSLPSDRVAFLQGLLSDATAKAAVGGISAHAYGYPPQHQLAAWDNALYQADPTDGIPLYSTETGSESLLDAERKPWINPDTSEAHGKAHVEQVLWWMVHDPRGQRYSRVYWFHAMRIEGKPEGNFGLLNRDGSPRLAGTAFKSWPRFNLPPAVPTGPLAASISGLTQVPSDPNCLIEYNATITGGSPPYSVSWSSTGQVQSTAGTSAWLAFYPGGSHTVDLFVMDSANITVQTSLTVQSYDGGGACPY